jgi:hypothetical protein
MVFLHMPQLPSTATRTATAFRTCAWPGVNTKRNVLSRVMLKRFMGQGFTPQSNDGAEGRALHHLGEGLYGGMIEEHE